MIRDDVDGAVSKQKLKYAKIVMSGRDMQHRFEDENR